MFVRSKDEPLPQQEEQQQGGQQQGEQQQGEQQQGEEQQQQDEQQQQQQGGPRKGRKGRKNLPGITAHHVHSISTGKRVPEVSPRPSNGDEGDADAGPERGYSPPHTALSGVWPRHLLRCAALASCGAAATRGCCLLTCASACWSAAALPGAGSPAAC
jgi:hypothetical protein